ncbi:hypothetical protein OC846_006511 [Tilletia horrida]|uniref:Uncharacterized protein n=1 Tax=Tilletia horrida TaxID=155126 RepID=A0AAN6JPA7_9BASI|nr:hypothetical protein OC845_006535 [Tilletia horrida]KAK0543161.1 hypothetical protein OC846_006511 [Tilletia horrida]KAK0562131.1 hypothetical protein OC861_005483 [Tilletia horrida]
MTQSRTITVKQNEPQITALGQNDLSFGQQIEDAQGHAHVNNIVEVTWHAKYALQWTQELPAGGERLSYNGSDWQPCQVGECYDINLHGFWAASPASGQRNHIGMGCNNYKHSVHIVIGLFNTHTSEYEPIFVDPSQLMPHGQTSYRPCHRTMLWFKVEAEPATFSANVCASGEVDTSVPNVHTELYFWTGACDPRSGSWVGDIHNAVKLGAS